MKLFGPKINRQINYFLNRFAVQSNPEVVSLILVRNNTHSPRTRPLLFKSPILNRDASEAIT